VISTLNASTKGQPTMDLFQAALIFANELVNNHPADRDVMQEAVAAVVETTTDVQEIATAISIIRWESGAFRRDVAKCDPSGRGDGSIALGLGQVHPINDEEKMKACSSDYREQVSVILFHIRDSVAVCRMKGYRGPKLLGQYVSGRCNRGSEAARSHWGDAKKLQRLLYTEDNAIMPKHPGAEILVCKNEELN
jgi:hypothetical protein